MPTKFNLPHIDVSSRAVERLYQAPKRNMGGGSAPRIREQHGQMLREQLAAAFLAADAERPPDQRLGPQVGSYLEIELRKANPLELEKKKAGLTPGASTQIADDIVRVALYVPLEARPVLESILNDYQNGPLSGQSQSPPRKGFVEPIEAIRQARLETLWTDHVDRLPQEPQSSIWWEVWCFKGMTEALVQTATMLGAQVAPVKSRLAFPEHDVIPIYATRAAVELLLFANAGIGELRQASATPTSFLEMNNEKQSELVELLAQRIKWPAADVPAVCLLDTGVNRAHVLIEPALGQTDVTTVDPGWGSTDDSSGHGTKMAGISLLGDLLGPLSSADEIDLTHRLESVKILPPDGFAPNDPRAYGTITQAAMSIAEIAAPNRRRAFCLAVTNENVPGNRASTWSAAIDQACVGRMLGDEDEAPKRLFFVSAGNIPGELHQEAMLPVDEYQIEDPAQAWNAITVGGYTEKTNIDEPDLADWSPVANAGEVSPFSRTSVNWTGGASPIKPEIVLEAGNRATNAQGELLSVESLALLTTGPDVDTNPLVSFDATSAAAAAAARIGASLIAAFPDHWPETIRALIVHSAEWTPPMIEKLSASGKKDAVSLLRQFGYGVPSIERAQASAKNHLALISQREIRPFLHKGGRKFRDCHFYKLPWPKHVLEGIEGDVRLKVTLSYFIEPNPGASSSIDPQRYQSFGLRFDLKRRLESMTDFVERVNPLERDDPHAKRPKPPADDGWTFGSQSMAAGSLHCDEWVGPGAQLASRDVLCVRPVVGWWRTRGSIEQCDKAARYSLVATLSAPELEIDLHTPILNLVENAVDVEIGF